MIITLCGSTKFKDDFNEVARNLSLEGHAVLNYCVFEQADSEELTPEQRIRLDNAQKEKINISDAIFVINKDSYIGEATYGCIDWAQRLKKEVYFLIDPNQNQVAPEQEEVESGPVEVPEEE